jgi:hypothetical protein
LLTIERATRSVSRGNPLVEDRVRAVLYVLAVWFLISVPLACFVGRLCRLGDVSLEPLDGWMPCDEPASARRRVLPAQPRCGEAMAHS